MGESRMKESKMGESKMKESKMSNKKKTRGEDKMRESKMGESKMSKVDKGDKPGLTFGQSSKREFAEDSAEDLESSFHSSDTEEK
jgi:hypothetical protein